ncbi:GOLPH3/VPS74 family protein [Phytohabitans flavus]|nr:GPP34 family phosphoprotein [Phytohabitans flavus]
MSSVALAEELLLLAYDNESGKAIGSRIGLDLGMAAAILVELALAGRIAYSDGTIIVTDAKPTGEPIADDVLVRIAADTPHTPASWVQRLRHGLRARVLADLCTRGVICDVDETAMDGYVHLHRYPTIDASVEREVRERLSKALTGEEVPAERTAALATLVSAVRMEPTLGLSGAEVQEAHKQLEKIAGGAGFSGSVGLEESTIRPSVALVIAALARAIHQALGAPRPAAS